MRLRRESGRARGFTLIEVLIAMALMAVLAVLGWRGLESVLSTQDRLTRSSQDLSSLSVLFAQLEEDLRRSWPVRLLNLPVAPIGFAVPGAGEVSAPLQLLREPPATMMAGTVQRVSYRLRNGVLERGFAPWSAPSTDAGAAQQPAPALVWQPLVGNVASVRMRGFIAGSGWVEGATLAAQPITPAAPAAPVTPPAAGAPPAGLAPAGPALVSGLEITVERTNGERVFRVFSVKD